MKENMKNNNTRFYEFFGLPGCGKTTSLREMCHSRNIPAYYVNGIPIDAARNSPIHIIKFIRFMNLYAVKLLFQSNKLQRKYHIPASVKPFFKSAYVLSLNIHSWKHGNKKNIVINDNGYIQLLISILKRTEVKEVGEFVEQYLDTYFSCLFPYEFIYLSTSPEICLERIYHRGKELSITREKVDTLGELYRERAFFEQVFFDLKDYFEKAFYVSVEKRNDNSTFNGILTDE